MKKFSTPNFKIQTSNSGFTLIEMMVAVSIFSVVMVISAGSIFAVLDANAKSQAVKSVLNNLNLALEGMARNIRAGSNYHCGNSGDITTLQDCLSGATYFAFESTDGDPAFSGDQVVYRLNGTQIQKSTNGGSTFLGITAPGVIVQDLKFYVDGSATDNKQPRALIVVRGYAGIKDKIKSSFNIQTTVSQRLLDIAP